MRSETTKSAARVINLMMRLTGASEARVYAATGISGINAKRRGTGVINLDDIEKLAGFFDVPVNLFLEPEQQVYAWIAATGWSPDGVIELRESDVRPAGTR